MLLSFRGDDQIEVLNFAYVMGRAVLPPGAVLPQVTLLTPTHRKVRFCWNKMKADRQVSTTITSVQDYYFCGRSIGISFELKKGEDKRTCHSSTHRINYVFRQQQATLLLLLLQLLFRF